MTYRERILGNTHLRGHWCLGVQALTTADAARIDSSRVRLSGSICIDTALRSSHPNANRWDYLVVARNGRAESAYWIEVHPASGGSNIRELEAKIDWLVRWIAAEGLDENPKRFIWIASGRSSFTALDPKLKSLARKGVMFVGRRLVL